MVELFVGSGSDFIDDGGLQVDEKRARDVLAGAGLAEERVEGVVTAPDSFVGRHLSKQSQYREKCNDEVKAVRKSYELKQNA